MAERHSSEPAFTRSGSSSGEAPLLLERLPKRVRVMAVLVRYALAFLLGYLGALKLSPVVAQLVQPLVANSASLSWLYSYLSVEWAARVIGAVEVVAALLLFASPFSRWSALVGSLLAIGVFVTTLSFVLTTPGTFVALPGFPLPAPSAGGAFLLKDVFLLGAAGWSLLVALRTLRRRPSK